MEWILALATIVELLVVAVLVVALWQDHRARRHRKQWEEDTRARMHGEDLNAITR